MAIPEAEARVLRSQSDIVRLFDEGPFAVFDFLSENGLIASEMLCDKCMPLDAPPGEGELQEMKKVVRDGEIRWRCYGTARHERTIRHHAEFFTWQGETSVDGRNNFNRMSIEQLLILTWCWSYDLTIKAAAVSAKCSVKAAETQYSQCRRVCFAALDDWEACPEAGLMGGEGHLVQIDECSVKARRKRAANGRGRLGPGDQQEAHRGNADEQAAVADDAALAQEEAANAENSDSSYAEEAADANNDAAEGWVFGICWWRSQQDKVRGIPNETRFFAVRDRTAATLLDLIQNHIAPSSQIWSDCWRSYVRIAQLPEQYIHLTINQSEHFTDPVSGVNTNAIEAAWSRLQHKIVRTKRRVGKALRYHLAELWWKSLQRVPITGGNQHKTKTDPRIFMNFLNLISRTYPL
uniref:ISXO2-like transposase domain-containing protein n=1 Tax=Plectus sambesii TaxID=2011161 RepID=A0A914WP24_9BILA